MSRRTSITVALAALLIAPAAEAQKRKLRPRGPVVCTGVGRKVVKNASIRGDKFGVAVRGACKIVIKDSEIVGGDYGALNSGTGVLELVNTTVRSPKIAVGATGTGVVRLDRAVVEGGRASVQLTGTGVIKARRTIFRGPKIHSGTGRFELDAKTRWEAGEIAIEDEPEPGVESEPESEPVAPSRRALKPHGAIRCSKSKRVTLSNVRITGAIAVMASGSCRVKLTDSEIAGTGTGLMASGGSRIVLVNTDVVSPSGVALSISGGAKLDMVGGEIAGRTAYIVSGGAEVAAKNVTIRGRGTKSKTAEFKDLGGNRFLRR